MRRLGQFLGQGKNRASSRRTRSSWQSKSARFELLEARQLLAVGALSEIAHVDSFLAVAGAGSQVRLTVTGGTSILGFRMQATGGNLDPDAMRIETISGHTIAPVLSKADANGGNDSLLLAELGPGTYNVIVRGEGASVGTYHLDVFMPGDLGADGRVSDYDLLWATAAMIQQQGGWNAMTAQFYKMQGIDLAGPSLYRPACDSDLDGDIDNLDLGRIDENHGNAAVVVSLVADMEAPRLLASLAQDTGRSPDDGITNQLAIIGSVHDDNAVAWLRAGFDNTPESSYVDVLADVDASGNFTLSLARLEQIAGGSLANTGQRVLHLIAQDEIGNVAPSQVNVTFTLDTIAPNAPASVDLAAASDLGYFDDDNVTADNTPTLSADAESQALVQFYANGTWIGEGIAASPVSITAPALADGDHAITATATDLAGNTSAASDPLTITISTTLPAAPTLQLAEASDTGALGDDITSYTLVTVEGVATAGLRVILENTGAETTADATGAFSFTGVPLTFGDNAVTVTAMNLAGNTASFTRTIKQNNAPTQGVDVAPDVDEDESPTYHDLTGLFADANLAAGDTLTLSIVADSNTNPDLLTATLNDVSLNPQIINGQLRLALAANQHGTATITLRATDSFGESVDKDVTITVNPVNDAPTLSDSTIIEVEEDSYIDVDLWTRVDDLETDDADLVFEIVAGSAVNGTAELLSDGHTVRFTPTVSTGQLAYFRINVTDTGDGTSAATTKEMLLTVTVVAVNDAPVATDYATSAEEDTVVTVDLRTLVSDEETAVEDLAFTVADAVGGTVVLLGGYTAQFTPTDGFNGLASFSFTVTDDGLDGEGVPKSATAHVTIDYSPVNDAPEAGDDAYAIGEDDALPVDAGRNLLANDTDPDAGDTLSATAETITSALGVSVTIHADGTFVYDPGATFNYLADDQSVQDTFSYTLIDGHGGSDVATVTITITGANDAPEAGDDAYIITEDDSLPVDAGRSLLANDTDPDAADALAAVAETITSALGVSVTINADGTFS
ncbi:MAG: tandem-95 repeat protein, partial [Pirellulales bacterium]|nr:tandem-95 repeat protein [Pirellulales bacterium]